MRVSGSLTSLSQVIVYVWAPEEEGQFQPGSSSRWWLWKSLKSLSGALRRLGGRLVLRSSRSVRPFEAPPSAGPAKSAIVAPSGAVALACRGL
jgi:deoxyribodipyrimidine photolyase